MSSKSSRGTLSLTWRSTVLSIAAAMLAVTACDDDPDLVPVGGSDAPVVDAGDAPVVEVGADTAGDSAQAEAGDAGPVTTSSLTILHTNDLHSHLQGHGPEADYSPQTVGDDKSVGGFARLATAIGTHKAMAMATGSDVLLLDGGDFMMGTLFQLGATTGAAELKLMQAVGYDAAAIGNHEYDWTPRGLAGILKAAYTVAPQVQFPLLASNLKFSSTSTADDDLEMLAGANGPIRRKFIKTMPSGLKVGFFGLLGAQAQTFAPSAAPITFDAIAATSTALVAELRNTDKVDVVVALSHSGINAQGLGEDANLAAAVPGIDVIVSGHTHDKLTTPKVVGKTIIVTAGSYGEYLGRLDLTVSKSGGVVTAVAVKQYNLLPIDDTIAGNAAVQTNIDNAIQLLDAALTPFDLSYKKVLAETTFDLPRVPFREFGLGDLITDAFRTTVAALQPDDPPVIAVEANGGIRADINKGNTGAVWFADLFQVAPLGIGPDQQPGYPLVTYYLNGKDLKAGLEVAAGSNSPALNDDAYFMQISGLEADYNMAGLLFQRVTAARLVPASGPKVAIDFTNTTQCYKVVTSIYLAGLFGLVKAVSGGLLSVEAKEKDCVTKVANLTSRIVDANPATQVVDELKTYQALAGYVKNLPDSDTDGVANIPAAYQTAQGRIKQTP